MALTNAQRKQAYRAKLDSMDLVQESIYVHNDDKQALRIYAARLRQARGCSLPTDGKILDDLPAPADSQILADLPVQTALVDPTIAQTKINGVAAVVGDWEARAKGNGKKKPWKTDGARWSLGFELLTDIKEALKNERS